MRACSFLPTGFRRLPIAFLGILVLSSLSLPVWGLNTTADSKHDFPGAYQVTIDGGPIDVQIEGTGSTAVSVVQHLVPDALSVSYSDEGGKVTITVSGTLPPAAGPSGSGGSADPNAADASNASDAAPGDAAGVLELTMPRYEFLDIHTTSGSVSIDNISTEKLSVATESGGVIISKSNAALNAVSTSGPQKYDAVYGAINAKSDSGAIEVDGGVGIMHLETQSGAVSGSGFTLVASSTVACTTGSVKMSFGNDLAALAFRLASDGGPLTVGTTTGAKSLDWGKSAITVTATATSGSLEFD